MCSGVCGAAVIWLASFVDVDATPSNEVMTPVAAEMRQHAESFLAALSDAQRLSAQKSIDDESRTDWTFFPRVRDGLELADLRENAVAFAAAEALLDCGLSDSGPRRPRTFVALIHKKIAAVVSGWGPIGMPSPFSGNLHQMHGGGGGLRDTISR